ncbi:MAG: RNA polymerase sigma factor [Porticoccaceae bacterium]
MKKIIDKNQDVMSVFVESQTVLKRFLRRFSSNAHDIEDICQETILRALEAERTKEITAPRAFLFGISKNIVRKKLDRESKRLVDLIEDLTPQEYVDTGPSLEECVDSQRQMARFAEAVRALPRQCQKVFVLKKVYGHSHQEISKELGISISTVEKHVAAGLKRCAEHMERTAGRPGVDDEMKVTNL